MRINLLCLLCVLSAAACRSSENPATDGPFSHDLKSTDLSGVDSSVDMSDSDLSGADLSGEDLPPPDLAGADLLPPPDMYTPPFKAPTPYTASNGPITVASADVNGDGSIDLVSTSYVLDANDGHLVSADFDVYTNKGDGTFNAKVTLPLTFSPTSISLGDVDGDGDVDALLAGFDGNIYVSLNTAGVFALPAPTIVNAAGAIPTARLGDIDGDGHLDVVAADWGDGSTNNGLLWVCLGNGDGTFPANKQTSREVSANTDANAARIPNNLRIGQLDDDAGGKLDIVVLNLNAAVNTGSFSVFQNTSTVGAVSLTLATELSTGVSPQDVRIVPVAGAHSAIAIANQGDNNAQVFLSNTTTAGMVGYGAAAAYPAFANMGSNANPSALGVADFDGDGIADLAILGGTGGGYLTLVYGGANGAFNVAIDGVRAGSEAVAIGNNPVALTIGLFDAGSKNDIAVAQAIGNDIAVLLNNR